MSKFQEIINGYKNLIWENPEIEKLAHDRALICAECDININNFCNTEKGGCGCFIPAKCHSEYSKCPKGKW